MIGTKVVVLISDRDDPKHGEISVVESARKAERLVETLLEAGFERERIRVFSGSEMDMQVTQRPVVVLVGEESVESTAAEEPEEPDAAEEAAAKEQSETEEAPSEAEGEEQGEEKEEEAAATAEVENGVRFSSLFRRA